MREEGNEAKRFTRRTMSWVGARPGSASTASRSAQHRNREEAAALAMVVRGVWEVRWKNVAARKLPLPPLCFFVPFYDGERTRTTGGRSGRRRR